MNILSNKKETKLEFQPKSSKIAIRNQWLISLFLIPGEAVLGEDHEDHEDQLQMDTLQQRGTTTLVSGNDLWSEWLSVVLELTRPYFRS